MADIWQEHKIRFSEWNRADVMDHADSDFSRLVSAKP